jgi:hypothetical protein
MTTDSIRVEKPAIVGVVQTPSERDHNSEAGAEAFLKLKNELPWVTYEFFDETSIEEFYRQIRMRRFSAVCFGSNSLYNPTIHAATQEAAEVLVESSDGGMGLILLQQFLPEDSSRVCDFLPSAHHLEYRGLGHKPITRFDFIESKMNLGQQFFPDASTFGDREPVLWSSITPKHPQSWVPLVSVATDSQSHVILQRTMAARGRTIASALPLDWMADQRLLTYAVRLAVRASGTLFVHSGAPDRRSNLALELMMGRSVIGGGHLSSVALDGPQLLVSRKTPFSDFSHLVISDEWSWPELVGLRRARLRARAENGGSVAAYGSGRSADGQRVLSIAGGVPSYLRLAQQFAKWFEVNKSHFLDAPTTHVRALAEVARAVDECVEDQEEIPRAITIQAVSRLLDPFFKLRLNGKDNVDGHVLPTASIASAIDLLNRPESELDPLVRWIEAGTYTSSFAARQQAALWLGFPRRDFRKGSLRPARLKISSLQLDSPAVTELERIDKMLLELRQGKLDHSNVEAILELLQDVTQPLNRRAVVADILAESELETLEIAGRAVRGLQNELDVAFSLPHAPVEVVCLLTAFLIRVFVQADLVAGDIGLHNQSSSDATSNHVREKESLAHDLETVMEERDSLRQSAQSRLEQLQATTQSQLEQLQATRTFAARATGWAVSLGLFLLLLFVVFLLTRKFLDLGLWAALVVGFAAGIGLTLTAFVGSRAMMVQSEPKFIALFRDIVSGR